MLKSRDSAASSRHRVFPLVSVIIGNYNYECYVRQAIDSVLAQTYRHFELIVIDDGSTDNSRAVIESYGDRLSAFFHENAGQETTFNIGIEKSQGDIICFLDADDYFHPKKLQKVVNSFTQHPEWVLIGHPWISINAEGQPVGKSASDMLSSGNVSHLLLRWGRYASAISSGLACRRSMLMKVFPIQEGRGVDTYINVAAAFQGEIGCVNEPLMYYRMHGRNMRAHIDDLEYLVGQRESTARFINEAAASAGFTDRFDIQRDADYLSYRVMEQGTTSLPEIMRVIRLSIQESFAIGRSPRDTLIRLMNRGFCVTFPQEGQRVLRLGFKQYLKSKILG